MNTSEDYNDEMFDILWPKLHAPKCIADMALSPKIRETINHYIEIKDTPTLLFCGKPGHGKTTLATLLCKELNATSIKINASKENGINMIRSKVTQFAETMSIDGSLKIIILDEADRLSIEAQDALKGIIDEYINHTRFILTANEGARITGPLKSRCTTLNITPPFEEYKKYIVNVLKKEAIKVTQESLQDLVHILKKNYPDIRQTLSLLQKYSISGELKVTDKSCCDDEFVKLIFDNIKNSDPVKIRELWIKNENSFHGDYPNLLKDLHNFIYKNEDLKVEERAQIILEIAEGLRNSVFVFDQEINFYEVILKIMKFFGKF